MKIQDKWCGTCYFYDAIEKTCRNCESVISGAITENHKCKYWEGNEADPVNHPGHYTSGEIECIDALKASMSHTEFCGFLKGNAMKYLWRYDKKGKATEDLEKSRWYLDRLWAEPYRPED